MGLYLLTRISTSQPDPHSRNLRPRATRFPVKLALRLLATFLFIFGVANVLTSGHLVDSTVSANSAHQASGQLHETLFVAGPSFNVGEIVYPSGHDFDTTSGIDTCLSLNVPPGDTFTLSLEWEALFKGAPDAGDLDLYIYLDSACTESALLTSSFNSNAYTGELAEITPQVRNISSAPAVAGIRIGKRSGRGIPGQLRLQVLTGASTFLEHGTNGPPLTGQEGAPVFVVTGPFSIAENSPNGSVVGTVTATDSQSDPLTFFELEPAAGQTSFQVDPQTGLITVEDSALLDREATDTVVYWVGVTDGTLASLASIGINLSGVNDNPPVALASSGVTAPDTSVVIGLTGTDADIDPVQQLSMSIVVQPTNGSVGIPNAQDAITSAVLYSPSPGFVGTDTFTFVVDDGLTTSAPATVTVTVTDDPTALPSPPPGPGTPTAPPATPAGTATSTPAGTATPTGGGSPTAPTPTPPPTSFFPPPSAPPPPPTSGAPVETVSPPSSPRFLRSEARDGSVIITWQRPLFDGGAPIDGYRIFNINTASSTLILGDAVEGQVRGLVNGTSYLFQVRAFNSAGFGDGALVGPVTPLSGNPIPLDVGATVHPDDTVTIWWSPPEGDRLEPVVIYWLWTEAGELLETIAPNDPLIVTLRELKSDAHHTFRVMATDADDEVVAAGVTDSVYLPPLLASAYEPMPQDAILVPLAEPARTELQLALQEAAGGTGIVTDLPIVLTVREGAAEIFVYVEGLHRALELTADFTFESDQLAVHSPDRDALEIQLELPNGGQISGVFEALIDPSGVLFQIAVPELTLTHAPTFPGETVISFEIVYPVLSLSPGFTVEIETPEELPLALSEALLEPTVRDVAGVFEVSRSGVNVSELSTEQARFSLNPAWHQVQVGAGREPRLYRIADDDSVESVAVTCESGIYPEVVNCFADLESSEIETSFYAIAAVSDTPASEPTPAPTTLSAPSDPPESTPTPTPGPSLVVVEDETPVPVPLPTASSTQPQITPTPSAPELPESGGGTSVVTWLMSGILGLVVIRGAFYAVGRIRA